MSLDARSITRAGQANHGGRPKSTEPLSEKIIRVLQRRPRFVSELRQSLGVGQEELEKVLGELKASSSLRQEGQKCFFIPKEVKAAASNVVETPAVSNELDLSGDKNKTFALHVLAAICSSDNAVGERRIIPAVCINALGLKECQINSGHIETTREILGSFVKDGYLASFQGSQAVLFTPTDKGRALIKDWHKSSVGKEFKALDYWA